MRVVCDAGPLIALAKLNHLGLLVSDRTALNDLKDMVRKRILIREGKTKSAVYRIPK